MNQETIAVSQNCYILLYMIPALRQRRNGGGTVLEVEKGLWRLEIPPGPAGIYRWAQLDDYLHLSRKAFPWRPGPGDTLRLDLRARVSAADLPGTWGFGLWNDPFSAGLGVGGAALRLPALPNTAWFFYAGEGNYLAFRDTHPAQGFLAATFRAPRIPAVLLAPGVLALPGLAVRPLARLLRRAVGGLVGEAGALVPGDPTAWRAYRLEWRAERVTFWVDGAEVFSTKAAPRAPLGLVLWIDNQYAAFPPSGRVSMGTSPNPRPAWLELADIQVSGVP
jgi:hypothetical protein